MAQHAESFDLSEFPNEENKCITQLESEKSQKVLNLIKDESSGKVPSD